MALLVYEKHAFTSISYESILSEATKTAQLQVTTYSYRRTGFIIASQKSHYKILHLLFNLVVTILQCCNLQQTCKPRKSSKTLKLLWSITTTQHKKNTTKASDTKKKTEKWFTLEQPNHPTLHILGEQLGARLRLHLLSHCAYPTKWVWIWPPFHKFVQKKVPVKQPPQTQYLQNWCNKVLLFSWKTDLQSHCFQKVQAHPCYPHTIQTYFWCWCLKCPTQGNWSQSKQPATTNRYGVYLQLAGGTFLSSNKQNAKKHCIMNVWSLQIITAVEVNI